ARDAWRGLVIDRNRLGHAAAVAAHVGCMIRASDRVTVGAAGWGDRIRVGGYVRVSAWGDPIVVVGNAHRSAAAVGCDHGAVIGRWHVADTGDGCVRRNARD